MIYAFVLAQVAANGYPWWAIAIGSGASALLTAPATLAVIKAREKRFGQEHGFAAEAFARSEEERRSIERDRDAKVQENAHLLAENVEFRRDVIEMRDELDGLKDEMRGVKNDLRECHEGRTAEAETHAANMQSLVLWMTDEMVRAGMRPSNPPKLRSITPARDMPAIQSPNAARETKT